MTAETNIVPFGKYRGMPTDVMLQDASYTQWLLAQAWFRERYAPIYNIVIGGGTEATDTPEHNAMQVLFLDDAFCRALFSFFNFSTDANFKIRNVQFEAPLEMYGKMAPVDVVVYAGCEFYGIELKPAISDDYPTVLRQMKQSGATILLTKEYTGQGATIEQFGATFRSAGISVLLLDNVLRRKLELEAIA